MSLLKRFAWFVTAVAAVLNVYIYTYPSVHADQCHWANEKRVLPQNPLLQTIASLPYLGDLYVTYFTQLEPTEDIRMMTMGDPQINGNWPSTPYIKRLDNYGNDYYLRHIYHTMKRRLAPDYVTIMGDLLSSQWISDSEFLNRTSRIIDRIFTRDRAHAQLEYDILDEHQDVDFMKFYDQVYHDMYNGLYDNDEIYDYQDVHSWYPTKDSEPLFLNITGNHDIGYGDCTFQHMARWHKLFGKDNFWIEYDNDKKYPYRIVMLNSLALDGPMLQDEFKAITWKFLEVLEKRPYNGATILLTHIPMYKPSGLCYDGPNVEYYEESGCHGCSPDRVGLLKSTNFVSHESSQRVMNAIFSNGKPGIILTGHDHYGCQNYYNFVEDQQEWIPSKTIESKNYIREVTVRSMMADYGGVTGIMTGVLGEDGWSFEYSECHFSIQHIWWVAQISLALAILLQSISFLV